MMKQIRALFRFLTRWSEEGRPSLIWLWRTSRRMNAAFAHRYTNEFAQAQYDDDFQYVTVKGKVFVWPRRSPIEALSEFLSELLQEQHPHHYITPSTPIDANDTVLDIGACEGGFSAFAAEKGANVIAIEPSRLMKRVMEKLFQLRGLPSPRIVSCLLGEGTTEVPFVDNQDKPGSSISTDQPSELSYPVRIMTLDEFVRKYLPNGLSYIKCDAEGWDAKILMSGRESLLKYRPKIAVTTYHHAGDYRTIASFLTSLDYKCDGKGLLYFPHQGEYRTLMLHATPKV